VHVGELIHKFTGSTEPCVCSKNAYCITMDIVYWWIYNFIYDDLHLHYQICTSMFCLVGETGVGITKATRGQEQASIWGPRNPWQARGFDYWKIKMKWLK